MKREGSERAMATATFRIGTLGLFLMVSIGLCGATVRPSRRDSTAGALEPLH